MITARCERQHGVVTRRALLAGGLSPEMIDNRVRSGHWQPIFRGVYRITGSPRSLRQRLLAACLAAGTDAVVSHRAAGKLWGIVEADPPAEVTVPWARRVQPAGILVHRAVRLAQREITRVEGIPMTRAARTIVDLAAVLGRPELEAVLDRALSSRIVSVRLVRRCLDATGRQGRIGAGTLWDLLQARPEGRRLPQSEFEARFLRLLRRSGLPTPECQFAVRLHGGQRAFVDFAYPHALLAIEADSYRHHSSLADWSRDRVRNNELGALGWRVIPVTALDVATAPEAVADQIARALQFSGSREG